MQEFWNFFWRPGFSVEQIVLRLVLAVAIGALIGNERAKHGRAAGMRTHILVCLGGVMTAMTSLYVHEILGVTGDVFRISAQVISGVGFLGAGMIILKNGNIVTGLTTAAGVWTTGAIGVALGYGFYVGAFCATVLFLIAIVLFAKLEKKKKNTDSIYLEIDDMTRLNTVLKELPKIITVPFSYCILGAKSNAPGHIGISMIIEEKFDLDPAVLTDIENVVFAVED